MTGRPVRRRSPVPAIWRALLIPTDAERAAEALRHGAHTETSLLPWAIGCATPMATVLLRDETGIAAHAMLIRRLPGILLYSDPHPAELGWPIGLVSAWTRPELRGRGLATRALRRLGSRISEAYEKAVRDERVLLLAEDRLVDLAARLMPFPVFARWQTDRPPAHVAAEEVFFFWSRRRKVA